MDTINNSEESGNLQEAEWCQTVFNGNTFKRWVLISRLKGNLPMKRTLCLANGSYSFFLALILVLCDHLKSLLIHASIFSSSDLSV